MRDKYKTLSTRQVLDTRSTVSNPIIDNKKLVDSVDEIQRWIINATRSREVDLLDYRNQTRRNPVIYDYTPTSSSDLIGTEKAGDISIDTSYLYIVVDNSGTLRWQRVAISTF